MVLCLHVNQSTHQKQSWQKWNVALWSLPKTSLYLYSWWWFHYGLQQILDHRSNITNDTMYNVQTLHTIAWTRALRVAVDCIWNTMSGPPSMSNANMSCENRVEVNVFCSYMYIHKGQLSASVLILITHALLTNFNVYMYLYKYATAWINDR